ncbi:enoyl-CoA hydratase [Alkalispirochaeta odontotermitis]|nr:enoyl-CoA hydratase [Alkalispirochaeta odontotermitis]CAB1084269.1 Enoyl-CoA hydratase (EC [Olavius algarvensis Delta 1 endosymbiont]
METPNTCTEILTDVQDRILRIKINRPEKKNALTRAMYACLAETLSRADDDSGIRVVFLQGTTDCFTAGNDLKDFQAFRQDGNNKDVSNFLLNISRAQKPIVAAVGGVAVGVGTTMLLHCDLVYAGEGAKFILPFVALGLCPEAASSYLFPKLVGHKRASELLLLGEPFSAAQACEIGLVNAVYPDAEFIDQAYARAQMLAQQPPASLRITKALLKRPLAQPIAEAMAAEREQFSERLKSGESDEAFRAFFERRKPDFSAFD